MNLHLPATRLSPVGIVLVGGVDPGTGAGLGRDLSVSNAWGARGVLVGTAWTEQGGSGAPAIEARDPERVRRSLAAARARLGQSGTSVGVKIGMIANEAIAHAILDGLEGSSCPVVFDPVLRATSGETLYQGNRDAVLALARRTTLLTPNLAEASWLTDRPVRGEREAREAARILRDLGVPAVLLKGGHLDGAATDILLWREGETLFSSPRVQGPSPRGTGCALATAIAVGLAKGDSLDLAVATAKAWLTERIAHATCVGEEWHLAI